MSFKHDAFISYSNKDAIVANLLGNELESWGLSFWLDERSLDAGSVLSNEIKKGIRNSKHLCVLWSKNSSKSKWVQEELAIAASVTKDRPQPDFVILIQLDGTKIPKKLSNKYYICGNESKAIASEIDKIIEKLAPKYKKRRTSYLGMQDYFDGYGDFSSFLNDFREVEGDDVDIMLLNGGATTEALAGTVEGRAQRFEKAQTGEIKLSPLEEKIFNLPEEKEFRIRAVFLDIDVGAKITMSGGYGSEEEKKYRESESEYIKSQFKNLYKNILNNSGYIQVMGSHEEQVIGSINNLNSLAKLAADKFQKTVSIDVRINVKFPSCRIISHGDVIYYAPLLSSIGENYYYLKIDSNFPLFEKCKRHFEKYFIDARQLERVESSG